MVWLADQPCSPITGSAIPFPTLLYHRFVTTARAFYCRGYVVPCGCTHPCGFCRTTTAPPATTRSPALLPVYFALFACCRAHFPTHTPLFTVLLPPQTVPTSLTLHMTYPFLPQTWFPFPTVNTILPTYLPTPSIPSAPCHHHSSAYLLFSYLRAPRCLLLTFCTPTHYRTAGSAADCSGYFFHVM